MDETAQLSATEVAPLSYEQEHLAFWQNYLAGAPTILELPADHRRPEQPDGRDGMQALDLDDELSAGLRALSRQERVELPVTLTAALAALLNRYSGQEDLLFGWSVSRRSQADARRPMGCFRDTAVLRADLAGEPSAGELLRRVHAASQATAGHRDVPFDAIVRAVQPERSLSRPPLVQVLLSFEPQPPLPPPGWEITRLDTSAQATRFDLCLEMEERAERLTGRLRYNGDKKIRK